MKWFDFKWKADAFIDAWSLVHLSWGLILGITLPFMGLSPLASLATAITLMIIWEIFEMLVGVGESRMGVVSDMAIGTVGFLIGSLIFTDFYPTLIPVLGTIALLMLIMEYFGWKIYLRKK